MYLLIAAILATLNGTPTFKVVFPKVGYEIIVARMKAMTLAMETA
jgi:hypothetical protein